MSRDKTSTHKKVMAAALFEPVIHGYSEEDARTCLETVEAFFLPGWKNLIGL